MTKSAFACLVGRPSSGKSTLLNALCGHKVSIVSPVPQTTRNKVRGIVNDRRGQLVFIDTPGFHLSERKFNLHMKDLVSSALEEVDLVLYVLDAARTIGPEEEALARLLAALSVPLVAAINKIDVDGHQAERCRAFIAENLPAASVCQISAAAETGLGILRTRLFEAAPEGEPLYPEDFYTDQDPQFRISEIIREQAIAGTAQEVPHAIYVEIADMEFQTRAGEPAPIDLPDEKRTLWVRAFIQVERESQKGIIVGRGGEKIRSIRKAAERELNQIFPYRVHLDLRVKVHPKWRSKDALLRRLVQ